MSSDNNEVTRIARSAHSLIIREDWILKRCSGKRVLHLGCTDSPATADKGGRGTLLHQRLASVCASLIGVDLNHEGLEVLRRRFGFDNLHLHNIEHLETLQLSEPIDVIVAGEVLEHLDNVGLFFEGCKVLLEPQGASLIVTVPNALSIKRVCAAFIRKVEKVHPDHTCYFSPSTLSEAARRHGMQTAEMRMFMWRSPTLGSRIGVALFEALITLFRVPILADGVAAEYIANTP
jgi:2-polyprenyl-3-methyl-5-hydroxy-6-metoxy-1,4-benzoquinol methylase